MPLPTFLAASLIVATGSALQGTIGFGLGLFAVPLLVLIEPRLVPGPILLASAGLTLLLTHREWHAVRLGDLKWSLSGRAVGTVLAALVLGIVPGDRLAVLFGSLVLLGVALSASGIRLPINPRTLVGAGTLAGFMGTAVSIGGPPVALLYQHEPGARLRGTLSAFFLVGVLMSVAGLYLVDRFGRTEFVLALALLPGILLGYLVSRRTVGLLDHGYVRAAVLVVSAASGLAVLLKELL